MTNNQEINSKTLPTYAVTIHIAGNYDDAIRVCREVTADVGLCVTITKTIFVYSFGAEEGVIVRLINYPRFPADEGDILNKAKSLAGTLMSRLFQRTCLISDDQTTEWLHLEDRK